MDEAKEELRGVVRKLRKVPPGAEDDFAINQQDILVQTFHRVGGIIASVGLFITGLSMFVGGIGIMNIMFVSVAERTREIGVRKAIGAKRRTILIQFLIEAATICLFGGLLGLAIAFPVSLVLKHFLPATMSVGVVALAIVISLVTGVVSGFLPAYRAARMNRGAAWRCDYNENPPRDTVASASIETNPDVVLIGVSPESFSAKSWIVEEGRALLASDIDSARSVCVLGNSLAKKVFPRGSAVGNRVRFRGINYAVVGVLEA